MACGPLRGIPIAVGRSLRLLVSSQFAPTSMTRARSPRPSPAPRGVINAVSLYVERGRDTFQSVHVEAAARVATIATRAGVKRLVHISGIGADVGSASPYIRSRGQGEAAVLLAFPSATLLRPAVMFGPEDAFLVPLLSMLRRLPRTLRRRRLSILHDTSP